MNIKCEGCGVEFEGHGRRKLCNDCRAKRTAQRNREWIDKAKAEGHYTTCKYCGTRVGKSDICSSCYNKLKLWGKIIAMVQRAKGEAGNE